jgi:very-short-patch-repair endonuclease
MTRYRGVSSQLSESARDLRHNQTIPEKHLWKHLRRRNLGLRIRRQHPVGPFVLDFYVAEVKLAVEIDGSIHNDPLVFAQDEARSEWLRNVGIHILRFSNGDVMARTGGVIDMIEAEIQKRRHESLDRE